MKIVVLDGYALNPGDLSWEGLKQLGDLEIHNRTETAQILSRAKYADLVLTNKTLLSSESRHWIQLCGCANCQGIGHCSNQHS